MTRLLVDASVLVSAAVTVPGSPSARLLDAVTTGVIEIVACQRLLDEIERALRRPYFAARLPSDGPAIFCGLVRRWATMLPDPTAPAAVLRDSGDDYLVALARSARVAAIVTGDRDLLDHKGLHPPAIAVRSACERFNLP